MESYRDATGTLWVKNEVGTYGVPGGEPKHWPLDSVAEWFGPLTREDQ